MTQRGGIRIPPRTPLAWPRLGGASKMQRVGDGRNESGLAATRGIAS